MLHSSVSCFKCFHVSEVCLESHGGTAWARGKERAETGPANAAHSTSGVLRTGRARPHPGS
jgi:hypothetical protein